MYVGFRSRSFLYYSLESAFFAVTLTESIFYVNECKRGCQFETTAKPCKQQQHIKGCTEWLLWQKENKLVTSKFQTIRRSKGITIHQVADIAGIEPREEYLFEIGARMDQQRAENIVSALNTLTGEYYTLADFRAPVTEQPTTPMPTLPIRRFSWPKHSIST